MEAPMQKALAHFVTDSVRVTAYPDHVKVRPMVGRGQLVIYGQIARNLFGNQEYLIPLISVREVTSIVGSTVSSEPESRDGKTLPDLFVEKVSDDLYRIGYSGDLDLSMAIMVDETALDAIIRACRVTLLTGDQINAGYDEDFWVVHATIDNDLVSISSRIFEITAENGFKITIDHASMGDWLQIFSNAEDLEPFEPRSMIRVNDSISLFKVYDGVLHLKMVTNDREIGITAKENFFVVCQRLMGIVWLGEDCLDKDFAFIDDDDEDEYDLPID
jgi:hypothetical protein